MHLEWSPNAERAGNQGTNQDQPEYWEEFWGPELTCCLSDSSERPSTNNNVKSSQGVK